MHTKYALQEAKSYPLLSYNTRCVDVSVDPVIPPQTLQGPSTAPITLLREGPPRELPIKQGE